MSLPEFTEDSNAEPAQVVKLVECESTQFDQAEPLSPHAQTAERPCSVRRRHRPDFS